MLFLLFASVYAQQCMPDVNFWGDFDGKSGDKEIELSIFRISADSIAGNCRFTNNTKEVFRVQGSLSNCAYHLTAINQNEEPVGKFVFNFANDKIKKQETYNGVFTSADNTQHNLMLQLKTMVGGSLTQRYFELFGTTAEVDAFATKVKSAIAGNDVQWIASNCRYPLTIYAGSHQPKIIKNQQEFFIAYKKLFTPKFKSKFALMRCYNMFSNHVGAGMGKGEAWINNITGSTAENYAYGISSFNIF